MQLTISVTDPACREPVRGYVDALAAAGLPFDCTESDHTMDVQWRPAAQPDQSQWEEEEASAEGPSRVVEHYWKNVVALASHPAIAEAWTRRRSALEVDENRARFPPR